MKLTMRATALGKRITLLTTAFVLAVSSLTALTPFLLSKQAHAASEVHTTNLSTWDLSQTRAAGHNELVSGGLHVWTDGNSDTGLNTDSGTGTWNTDKAAGYYNLSTPIALSSISSTSITFSSFTGGRPSVQLGVDRDGNGTWDGYLVYEPWAYGDGQYWTNKTGFGVAAGGGYPSMGTLAQYAAANPNAKVSSIGYSLGSGVQGDATISSIVIGDTSYTFDLPPVTLSAPTNLVLKDGAHGYSTINPGLFPLSSDPYNAQLSWGAVAGATGYSVEVYKDGTLVGGSSFGWNGSWVGFPDNKFGSAGDGSYTFVACATNPHAVVTKVCSAPTAAYVYDRTAPTITSITANGRNVAVDGSTKVNTTNGVTFNVKTSDPAGFGYTYVEMNKNLVWQAANTGASTTTLTVPANKFVDGQQYGLKICPYDKVGNGACSQIFFSVDNTSPTMALRYGESGSVITSGSIIDNTGKNIRIDKENTASIHVTKPNGSTWVGGVKPANYAGGKLSMDFLFTADGTYTFYVEDEAGNVSQNYTVVIDTKQPTIQNVAVTQYTNQHALVVTGTVNDANLDYYRCNVYDAANHTALNGVLNYYTRYYNNVTNGQLCSIDISNLPSDGTYNVRVVAYDKAGHTNVNNYMGYAFAVDTTAPVLTINGSDASSERLKTGDTIDVQAFDTNYDRTEVVRVDAGASPSDRLTYTDTQFDLTNKLRDGAYTVTAYDKAGNHSTQVTLTINNGMVVTFSKTIPTNTAKPAVSGLLQYSVDETPVANTDVVVTIDGTPYSATTDGDGLWTVTPTVANGTHVVKFGLASDPSTKIGETSFTTTLSTTPVEGSSDTSSPSGGSSPSTGGTPAFTSPANGLAAVLGTSTTGNTNDPASDPSTQDVKGTSTENQPASATDQLTNTDGKAFGLAWYWWLLIVAAAAAIIWWIASAIRNRQPQA